LDSFISDKPLRMCSPDMSACVINVVLSAPRFSFLCWKRGGAAAPCRGGRVVLCRGLQLSLVHTLLPVRTTMSSSSASAASSSSAPSVTSLAYLKMVLHAVRYPARPVMGVLLGSASGVCQNCVPTFHSNPLAPALEISFLMVRACLLW
jgi:hypothetical protein